MRRSSARRTNLETAGDTGTLPLDIICFADMAWDYPLWTNRQHVMSRVPSRDRAARVLYVSPPRFALSALRSIRAGRWDRSRRTPLWTEPKQEGLWVVAPLLPVPNRVFQRYAPRLYDRWIVLAVRHAARRLGFVQPVLWSYTPFAGNFLGRMDERLVVYDVVDDYPALPHYQTLRRGVSEADASLAGRADIVFHTSSTVFAARADLNAESHLVGNAADIGLFATAQSGRLAPAAELRDLTRPILLFHGAVTGYKLDLGLIRELADAHPEWSLVFVGPVMDEASRSLSAGLPNVHLLGTHPHAKLPSFLAAADLSIIPYQRNAYTEGINALKLYECLAAGKRVVATDLPCFAPFAGHVALATTAGEFGVAIARMLAQAGQDDRADRLERVREFSWDAKVDTMLGLIRRRLATTASQDGR